MILELVIIFQNLLVPLSPEKVLKLLPSFEWKPWINYVKSTVSKPVTLLMEMSDIKKRFCCG